jgi:glucosamine--fructose-6-phosphate aminotransferase (isomerizing)
MCGIIGVVGDTPALPVIIGGLRRLEYRGYDSAGVAVVNDGRLRVVRKAGKLDVLDRELTAHLLDGVTGIGHTRWATHGGPTDQNAHPHQDCHARVAVIHNGIIENFIELREELTRNGHIFASETDTEVLVHLIEANYEGDLVAAVRKTLEGIDGAFSVAVVSADHPGLIVAAKRVSPLIVGRSDHGTFLASDPTALIAHTREMVHVLDDQLVEIRRDGFTITTTRGEAAAGSPIHVDWDLTAAEKSGYDTFMLKEIYEQPAAIANTLRGRLHDGGVRLDGFAMTDDELRTMEKVVIVACGSAFHAGLAAKYALERWTRLPVEIDIASEFRYRSPVLGARALVLAVSQSGETIDTLEAVKFAHQQQARVAAVVNVVGSSVAREADAVLYTHAGPEIAVASTKAFTAQVVGLTLLALHIATVRGSMSGAETADITTGLATLPRLLERTLRLHDQVREIATELQDASSVFFLGRHTGYPTALEGALKLKEISYVHAEGFAAGELKHGPIALLDTNVPVIAVATNGHVFQ